MSLFDHSNEELSFKAPLIHYIIKNASTNVKLMLCKCSKKMKALVKAKHGLYSDLLNIATDENYYSAKIPAYPFKIIYGNLIGEFKMDSKLLSEKIPIKATYQLCLYLKRNQRFDDLLPKLDLSEMKRIIAKNGYINFEVLKYLLNPSLIVAKFEYPVIEGCDALKYILSNCPMISFLTLSFQPKITNLAECSKIQRKIKLKTFVLAYIEEYVEAEDVANFINNQAENDAKIKLYFRLRLPEKYEENLKALIHENVDLFMTHFGQ